MPPIGIIRSMTGFGTGSGEAAGAVASVDLRAVNHRGLKLNVRSRPGLGALEKDLRDRVQAVLQRGAVDVYVNLTRSVDADHLPVREDLARAVVAAVRHLGAELSLSGELSVSDLVQVPGLFETGVEEAVREEEWPAVEAAVKQALAQATAMREVEGRATAERLLELVETIDVFAREIRAFAPQVVERTRQRLETRLGELRQAGLDTGDRAAIEREVCLFADRADINEEMDRLDSHVAQYRALLAGGGEVGKRLEFLAQEFLREINTTASKANDPEIVTRAIDAKLAVEKIKEQAANLE